MTNTPNTEPEGPRLTAAKIDECEALLSRHVPKTRYKSCTLCGDSAFDHECNDDTVPNEAYAIVPKMIAMLRAGLAAQEANASLEAKLAAAERERDEAREDVTDWLGAVHACHDMLDAAGIPNRNWALTDRLPLLVKERDKARALAAGKQATGEGVARLREAAREAVAAYDEWLRRRDGVLACKHEKLSSKDAAFGLSQGMRAIRAALAAAPSERAGEVIAPGFYSCDRWPFWFMVRHNSGVLHIWGFSIWKGEPGYRTLGIPVEEWRARHPEVVVRTDRDRERDTEFVKDYRVLSDDDKPAPKQDERLVRLRAMMVDRTNMVRILEEGAKDHPLGGAIAMTDYWVAEIDRLLAEGDAGAGRETGEAGTLVQGIINALTAPGRSEHQQVRDAILALAQAIEARR